jgi:hypothetical protein
VDCRVETERSRKVGVTEARQQLLLSAEVFGPLLWEYFGDYLPVSEVDVIEAA